MERLLSSQYFFGSKKIVQLFENEEIQNLALDIGTDF